MPKKKKSWLLVIYPGNIYLFKVINGNTRKRCEIFSKLTKSHQKDAKVSSVWYLFY